MRASEAENIKLRDYSMKRKDVRKEPNKIVIEEVCNETDMTLDRHNNPSKWSEQAVDHLPKMLSLTPKKTIKSTKIRVQSPSKSNKEIEHIVRHSPVCDTQAKLLRRKTSVKPKQVVEDHTGYLQPFQTPVKPSVEPKQVLKGHMCSKEDDSEGMNVKDEIVRICAGKKPLRMSNSSSFHTRRKQSKMDDFFVKIAPRNKGKHKMVEGTGIKEDVGVSSSKKNDCKEGVVSLSDKDVVIKQEQSPTVLLCDCDCFYLNWHSMDVNCFPFKLSQH